MTRPFRILSLSGGGMRGVFTAAVLCELEAALTERAVERAKPLVDHFDLVVGTSTGGLLALGLAFGRTPAELLAIYKAHGTRVFPRWWRNWRTLGSPLFPLFSQRRLREIVEAMVPRDRTLGDASCRLVLPAVRRDTGMPTCLKTKHDPEFYKDYRMSAVDAGLATAAAPVAFGHIRTREHGDLVDGGLWANTPILVGLIEASRYFKRDLKDIRVVSVGTTYAALSNPKWWHWGGILEYGGLRRGRLQPLLWAGQRNLALAAATLLLADENLVHIDHQCAGNGYSLMDARPRTIRTLEQAGRQAGQTHANKSCALLLE